MHKQTGKGPEGLEPSLEVAAGRTAMQAAEAADVPELVRRLAGAMDWLSDLSAMGLGLQDAERDTVEVFLFDADRSFAGVHRCELTDASGGQVAERGAPGAGGSDGGLGDGEAAFGGLSGLESVRLEFAGQSLGWLYLKLRSARRLNADEQAAVNTLSTLIAPLVWSLRTREWFERGDRRRDTLVALSHVINTPLDVASVVRSALRVLHQLDLHAGSGVLLLGADGRLVTLYPLDAAEREPAPIPLDSRGGLAHLIRNGETHLSDDLQRRVVYPDDEALRAAGVRRYVLAPLLARGKILGAVRYASGSPHRPGRVDCWLFENIALQLALAIDNAEKHEQLQRLTERLSQQNVYLREEILSEHNFHEIVGRSAAMQRVFRDIARVAPTPTTVLITGETGVGKELVARAVHAASPVAAQPMVKVNCAAIPEGTIESELFGHERGAFTSAVERRLGRFELARNSTLFLDEIGELSLAVQAKLLRVLQDGEFERVGGAATLSTNARIIAATNRNLLKAVESGAFRRDLYYRLNVFPIEVPPLRERREDIPLLAATFIEQFSRRMGKPVPTLTPSAMNELCQAAWPGNVRELRHVIERAMILCDGPALPLEAVAAPHQPTSSDSNPSGAATLQTVEAEHIRRTLERTHWVVEGPAGAAALLGLNPSTLRFRMKRLGIRRPEGEKKSRPVAWPGS